MGYCSCRGNINHRQLYFQAKNCYIRGSVLFDCRFVKGRKPVKPEQLYQQLKDLAEKISIRVTEHNFRITTGIHVKSGFCKVKDQDCCIIDKHLKLSKKMEALAECIHEQLQTSNLSIDTMYLVPAVREYMERFLPIQKEREPDVQLDPVPEEQEKES
jgi:hypothetical protein